MTWRSLIYAPVITFGNTIAPRGFKTRELVGWHFRFNKDQRFIHHRLMPLNKEYLVKELEWYIRGQGDDVSIAEHAQIWNDIYLDDGQITSNYGYLLWGIPDKPLARCLAELMKDPYSRRAVAHINRPEHHDGRVDLPCTLTMQFLLRDHKLTTVVTMRSQDAVFGLRNDLPFFWFVADVVAARLGVEHDSLHLNVGSFHVYERHFTKVQQAVDDYEGWLNMSINWEKEVADVISRIS